MSEISREDALAHFGVKGMRWGVRNDTSTSSSKKTGSSTKKTPSAVSKVKDKVTSMSPAQKRIAIAMVGTGGAVVASMLAGPVGGMSVGALGRMADQAFTIKTSSKDSFPLRDAENWDMIRERRGDGTLGNLVPNVNNRNQ